MPPATAIRHHAWLGAGCLWLVGFHLFTNGFHHMRFFWWVVAPLTLLQLRGWWRGLRGIEPWQWWLVALLGWQVLCSLWAQELDGWHRPLLDAAATAMVVALTSVVGRDEPWWQGLRLGLFVVGVASLGWSLWRFYPQGGLGLLDERLRNVWVYPRGLNAVLTGLLAGSSILAGASLAPSYGVWRRALWPGLALLAFALGATQSRGPMLALAAGLGVWAGFAGRRCVPELAAIGLGGLAYAAVLWGYPSGAEEVDLVQRGDTGRLEIWRSYLERLDGWAWLRGQGEVAPLGEEVLGWWVHHPHASWLSQLVWCGLPGLGLLAGWIGWAMWAGWRRAGADAAPLALLAYGCVGLAVDGAEILSLGSVSRIEPLLVLVPGVVALAGLCRQSEQVGPG